ncbi:MAG: [protein-PII] uridylyltransferase [Planctomycetaceae bacterium]|nr:[protein-PII] uridylyltransferase [Planctomycetaceae bacterium]
MNTKTTVNFDVQTIADRRKFLSGIRLEAASLHQQGKSGIEVSEWFSDQLDLLLREMMLLHMSGGKVNSDADYCLIAVGGNGRRRPAPYSDLDLMVVATNRRLDRVQPLVSGFVRDCWDSGFQLGHSVRTPDDVVGFASEDIQFATSLVHMRLICGSASLFQQVQELTRKKIFSGPGDRFINACVASRRAEWMARGDSVNQLEPDIKRSPGGLRDLHLLSWVAFAQFGNASLDALLEHNSIGRDELKLLRSADEYLTSLRLDLHTRARLKQDVLTRELQLEICGEKGMVHQDHRRAVESFMQEYFRTTSRVAEIARRVAEIEQRPNLFSRLKNAILPPRDIEGFTIVDDVLNATPQFVQQLTKSPEDVMVAFVTAARHGAVLSGDLRKIIGGAASRLPGEPSQQACSQFRAVLRSGTGLPDTLRAMYETQVLDWLVPAVSEIRCLMQFNQYHSYTVDEHTLKTIDEVVTFVDDTTPLGTAYNSVRHKATLHLALILHDVGKGRAGDHCITGEAIAEETATRLQTPENKKRMMMALVRHHLVMPDLAFRRDITDQTLLVEFARLVGAPELLRMLYVLSVADIKAVGPDVWTDWKGDLLADLYNRTMLILSGRPINHLERERLQIVREHVRASIVPVASEGTKDPLPEWIDRQLDALPPFYLMMESADRIARDLDIIQQLAEDDVRIEGEYDPVTDTVNYRVIAGRKYEAGSFHKVAGVLSGLRMDIHTAQSCTTTNSTVVGSFLVSDNDFVGTVAQHRIQDVCKALADVLTGKITVDHIFRRSGLFRMNRRQRAIAPVEPRVSIDNDCSEKYTVVDVFAMDCPGLLYTLALTLYRRNLSVELARIATNVDQVVDVFYIADSTGHKIEDSAVIDELHDALMTELRELEKQWATA